MNQPNSSGLTTSYSTPIFSGSINKAATLTANGSPVTVDGNNNFSTTLSLSTGTNTVSLVALDAMGNQKTSKYQFTIPASTTAVPTFDADGNELTNGSGEAYTWDALDELSTITYAGGGSTVFTYDALGRRISESDNGTLAKQWVWDGGRMVEERNTSNIVTKRFYGLGEQIGGTAYYCTRDHLGSVREMTNGSGVIQARYDYDPYGRVIPVGTINAASDFQYGGYYEHTASGLNLTKFRAYDPNSAKWLSRDPLGEQIGINIYEYADNNPVVESDVLGLCGGRGNPNHGPVVITNPLDAFMWFVIGGGKPAQYSKDLLDTFQADQSKYGWGITTDPMRMDLASFSYLQKYTVGGFRFTNDGTTTKIIDYYGFPPGEPDFGGQLDHYIFGWMGTMYPISNSYPTPKSPK